MTPPRHLRPCAALLITCACLASAPLWAQQTALPDVRDSAEFGVVTAERANGRPRWQGQVQMTLEIVPTCQIGVGTGPSPSIRCTRGVTYRTSLSSDASPAPWATPVTVLASSARDADAGQLVRITEQRLLVEF